MKQELAENLLWPLAACGIFIFLNIDLICSLSVAVAHHFPRWAAGTNRRKLLPEHSLPGRELQIFSNFERPML
jgi:hypothetical protein